MNLNVPTMSIWILKVLHLPHKKSNLLTLAMVGGNILLMDNQASV